MSRKRATRFIRSVIYKLKRRYGFRLTLYKIVSVNRNADTGEQQDTVKLLVVNRAVLLPTAMSRKFIYDPAYLKSNKNFTTGGTFDPNGREILLDYRDIGDFNITIDDYVIYNNKRWQVTDISEFELKTAIIIKVCESKGNSVNDVTTLGQPLVLTQTATGTI